MDERPLPPDPSDWTEKDWEQAEREVNDAMGEYFSERRKSLGIDNVKQVHNIRADGCTVIATTDDGEVRCGVSRPIMEWLLKCDFTRSGEYNYLLGITEEVDSFLIFDGDLVVFEVECPATLAQILIGLDCPYCY